MAVDVEQDPNTPQGLGAELRRLRETAGLSLADISAETKISSRVLLSLENGDYRFLPEKVFCRNFIRQIVGLSGGDPDELIRRFDAAWSRTRTESGTFVFADVTSEVVEPPKAATWPWWLLAAIILVILLGLGWWLLREDDGSAAAEPGDPTGVAVQLAPTRARPSPTPVPSPTAVAEGMVVVEAKADCWVRYREANGRAEQATVGPDRALTIQGEMPIQVTLGNAGVASVEVDGRRFDELGSVGQVVHLEIDGQTLRRLDGGSP